MSIVAGSVTVADDGGYTGTGASLTFFTAILGFQQPDLPDPTIPDASFIADGGTPVEWSTFVSRALANVKKEFAKTANALGSAYVTNRDTDVPSETRFTTTDATPVDTLIAVVDNEYAIFRVTTIGRNFATGAQYVAVRTVTGRRWSAGVPTVSSSSIYSDTTAGPSYTEVASGNDIAIRITGPVAQTWQWSVSIQLVHRATVLF